MHYHGLPRCQMSAVLPDHSCDKESGRLVQNSIHAIDKRDFSLSTQYTQGRDAELTISKFERAYANSLIPESWGRQVQKRKSISPQSMNNRLPLKCLFMLWRNEPWSGSSMVPCNPSLVLQGECQGRTLTGEEIAFLLGRRKSCLETREMEYH